MQVMRKGNSCKTLFRLALVNFVTFVVLKILDNLFSLQNSLNAKTAEVSEISKAAQRDLSFILDVLLESSIHFSRF